MFNFFRKKSAEDSWIASVKTLKEMRKESYKELTREEIKKVILEKESEEKGDNQRKVIFPRSKICKEDAKTLRKSGYYVYCGTREIGYKDVPCICISW